LTRRDAVWNHAAMDRIRTRRALLARAACCLVASTAAVPFARAHASAPVPRSRGERWIELLNTHTSETLTVAYRDATGFVAGALERLNWLLRDHRAQVAAPMDAQLFEQLTDLAEWAGRDARFEVISGYRSPQTNHALAEASRGVATRSLHMQGKAIDVRLRGFSTARLRDLALEAGRGGVGYYARSDFLHVDTGRFRTWAG
jgi:uncharacterized protein YcbK (DUF882 family)